MSLNIEKANLPTGSDAILYPSFRGFISPEVTFGTAGSELEAVRDRTGDDAKVWNAPVWVLRDSLTFGAALSSTTSYGRAVDSLIRTFLFQHGNILEAITGYYLTINAVPEIVSRSASITPYDNEALSKESSPQVPPASRLREISGIGVTELSWVFSVSRPSFHKWMTGTIPRRRHREHLSQALGLVEEALRRLGNPQAVGAWLNRSVSAAGTRPLDLLREKQFLSLRGFMSKRTAEPVVLQPAFRPSQRAKPGAFDEALAMLRPHRWESAEEEDE